MADRSILIRGVGDYYAPVDSAPAELMPLVKETIGSAPRRLGRFIQLALIGAGRALGGQKADPKIGVYLTSGRGDMQVTTDVMQQVYVEGTPPRPLSFINTVSNTACFYIAKQFGLAGRSSFVCNRYFSFESALSLAMLDIEVGVANSALVGSVDIALAPLDIHRRRLRLDPQTPVAEGAHWLWLEAGDASAVGPRITSMEFPSSPEALANWISEHSAGPDDTAIAIGQFADANLVHQIAAKSGLAQSFDYRSARAYYDSQSAAAPSAFLGATPAARTLLHINADDKGNFGCFAVKT